MENFDDEKFERTLTQLHREQLSAPPEFDAMWSLAQGTVNQRSVRRRRTRLAVFGAVCLMAVLTLRPWADQEEAVVETPMQSIDFAHLNKLIEEHFQTPQWTDPSPTQFLVEVSPQFDSSSSPFIN